MNNVQKARKKRIEEAGAAGQRNKEELEKKMRREFLYNQSAKRDMEELEKKRGLQRERHKKIFNNDFIRKLKTDHSNKANIAVNSLGRSGSGLIARISSQLGRGFSLGVGNIGNKNNKHILVIRNWNDVLVSYWKALMSENERYNEISSSKPTNEEIDTIVTRLERNQNVLRGKYTPETLVLYYEKFYDNYDYIYDHLELFLDITIDKEKRDKITSNVSREATKKIQKQYKTFGNMSGEHVHGNHISNDDGLPGSWKKYLDFDVTK